MQKLCCRQKAPLFFPTAVLLPSQHNFYQHIRAQMLLITFAPFTLFDSDDHSLTIDIRDLQADRLRDAQSGRVAGRKDRAMLDTPHTAQKPQNFFRTQDDRQLLRLLGRWHNFFKLPILMERYFVEETKRCYSEDDRAWSELPLVG